MDAWINELLETYLGEIIDKSRDELTLADETCRQNEKELDELEKRYLALNLAEADRILLDGYIVCMQRADQRNADLSYVAGVRDTVKLLHGLDLLKDMAGQE